MKKVILFYVLVLISCEKTNENINYPLSDLRIQEIKVDIDDNYVKNFNMNSDSIYLANVLSYLYTIKGSSFVKGKRIHNVEYRGKIELISHENKSSIVIVFNENEENGIVGSFLIKRKDSNFQEFLGSLYNADNLLELIIKN